MKKIFILLFASLLITSIGFAASLESGEIAELYELNKGRSILYDESELVILWYEGAGYAEVGTSGNTATGGLTLQFYVDGQPITATRFQSAATIDIDNNDAAAVVSIINSDTSGDFKASLGRDATPGTCVSLITFIPASATLPTSRDRAITNANLGSAEVTPQSVLLDDMSRSLMLRAGFAPDERITYRLKRIEETCQGDGAHVIKVWDGETCVYRRAYATKADYAGTGTPGETGYIAAVTPLTIDFAQLGGKGLCASKGNNLTVTSEWDTTMAGATEATENLSIIVGEWKE